MSDYRNNDVKRELVSHKDKIYEIRRQCMNEYNIDILDTDALSALSVYEIISQYDPDYDINFSRNGEDGKSKGISDIEMKSTKVEGYLSADNRFIHTRYKPDKGCYVIPRDIEKAISKRDAKFQFHVMGDIVHDAYIFVVSRKETLEILRMYDIREPKYVAVINSRLADLRTEYLKESGGSVKKRDVVYVLEEFLLQTISFKETLIDNVIVHMV